jgi:uncharacterized membrane protein affecting hemolysin expression
LGKRWQRSPVAPDELSPMIRATSDEERLDAWLDQVVTAETLDEVGIAVTSHLYI